MMFKDVYFYRARFLPAVVTSVPMLIFINKVLNVEFYVELKNILEALPIITHFALSIGIIYLCVHLNRLIAKELIQRFYFKDELYMPTTNVLLWSNPFYEKETKEQIRNKIKQKFGLHLLDEQEETLNEKRARKLIIAATAQIRIALQGNKLLFQHNWEYGLWRNLIGGSILSVLFSIGIIIYGHNNSIPGLFGIGVICLVIYLLPILFSKMIVTYFGRYYQKICYDQFLSL